MDRRAQSRDLRVAIIGFGPKGLFALERLLDHLAEVDSETSIGVDVFDPHPALGAGPNYDPGQPEYLRMNFRADLLDMWWPAGRAVPSVDRRSFVAWRRGIECCPDAERDTGSYPPRAQVGRYLADGYALLLRHAPPNVHIQPFHSTVTTVHPGRAGWKVLAAGSNGPYDEVLITTGHERSSKASLASTWSHAARLLPAVFPVSTCLARGCVAPGATLAVRGFALSFMDACLALTEGRGGAFEAGEHPYRLRYTPGDDDAALILPYSRTGRPMLAKPPPELAATIPTLEAISEHGRTQILSLSRGVDLHVALLPIVAWTAASSLLAANGCPRAGERLRQKCAVMHASLARAVDGVAPRVQLGPATELERSLAVGAGLLPPDEQWAAGHAWRTLYPALVDRLGGQGLAATDWPAFRRLAAAMERVAFGPSPLNAAKTLALIDAGRIDLTHVAGGQIVTHDGVTWLRSGHDARRVELVLDALLPAPGARELQGGLLSQLVRDGHARIASGRRGLEVDADGGCRGRGGARTPGLSASGRPTEDVVIGNDTLSPTLHPLADRWARRIAQRCRGDAVGAGARLERHAPG